MLLTIIDYGVGNLRSIAKSIEKANSESNLNYSIKISSDVTDIKKADKLVLPGQGSFKACREGIKNISGLDEELNESVINKKKPIPVSILYLPLPSIFTSTVILVSLVFLEIFAFLFISQP